ncbi:hypothetical protein B0I72DRAFT_136295 [Yarrowia lipolytica]|jgi:hypothetical protein|uniref:YALI0A20966p n=2 Tax=Yarrowia lipolytica TaxID=4952 RepID=Q6CGA1_YARLI|nr:YALI0A20966p [Yarrowia lipolytica CLIB122]AOW00955.1 hypothetical protein YALI1_A22008g [Yarrowia lipolytica]KAB8280962.1 hypothetical protein BKA91DRAFT_140996 [Yarrowia lipolytica]KAE8174199.1 hypothetical protein BKA90DRAFT_134555 [Yarrowia lipolytica]KAJ8051897.1 hypothetical protein LXG23DRAFT_53020 [Yarrowia lipolytica]QNP95334.1 Hypothetical protein YALI2_A00333g [Yarrowia lipolytica]|eukprot:XP_500311.1 YALI0A20966p [Yarrowia lipolytica CLIB122]
MQTIETYNFDSDPEFNNGLNVLLANAGTTLEEENKKEQESGHKSELIIKAKEFYLNRINSRQQQQGTTQTEAAASGEPTITYSDPPLTKQLSYEELVDLISSGKEVPGIRQIPDTVLGHDASSAATTDRPKKPWEK